MTQEVIRAILQQPTFGEQMGQSFRRAQTFPMQLQAARQQLDIRDLIKRFGEAKLQAMPEEMEAKRAAARLGAEEKLAGIGLKRAQTIAALTKQKQKTTSLEKFQQGLQRLQQFGDNDLQGRFLVGDALSDAGFKLGGLGQFSETGVAPKQTASLNASMLQPHSSDQTTEEMLNEQHQIHPPVEMPLTPEDKSTVSTLQQGQEKSRNIIDSMLQKPEVKMDEFEKGQLTNLNKTLKEVTDSAANAAEKEKPLYRDLIKAVDEVPSVFGTHLMDWASPAGQRFQALLARAQGEFLKTFHLGRMTQLEFNILGKAVGGKRMYTWELKNLFERQMRQLNQDINKAKFYHDYVGKGGRSAEDAAYKWLQKIETEQPMSAPTGKPKAATPVAPLEDAQLAQIAQEAGVDVEAFKKRYRGG